MTNNILEIILPELQKITQKFPHIRIEYTSLEGDAPLDRNCPSIIQITNIHNNTLITEWRTWINITEDMIWAYYQNQQGTYTYCQENWTDPQLLEKLTQHIKNLAKQ